jgi:hydroxymethylpyrimidine/phosphomethylpyrimidine kinase
VTQQRPASRLSVPAVLSVAGSDPSGGAGIQADLKTFAAFGVYGAAVITALTAQNSRTVAAVRSVDAEFVRLQLETVLDDIAFSAIKIGMLGTAAVASTVARVFARRGSENIIIDPVLTSSAGPSLLDDAGIAVLREELFPIARLITPNAIEAGALLRRSAPTTVAAMQDAARALLSLGSQAVLVKGGHVDTGDFCIDMLAERNGEMHEMIVPRASGSGRHGTGCTLSSAIASLLAAGHDLVTACEHAQAYMGVAIGLETHSTIGREPGPLLHVPYSPLMAGPSS